MSNLEMFGYRCRTISNKFNHFEKYEVGLNKNLTPILASLATAFIRDKIRLGGKGLPNKGGYASFPITTKWKEIKEKYAKSSELPLGNYYATGSVFRNIKKLKKKSSSIVIGLDETISVPHFGYGGYSKTRTIKIGKYVNYLASAKKSRPFLVLALSCFAARVFPEAVKSLKKSREEYLTKYFSPLTIKETVSKDNSVKDVKEVLKKLKKSVFVKAGMSQASQQEVI